MSSGTDAPPDKPDADRKRGFDDAWTELVGAAPAEPAEASPAESPPDAGSQTRAWDDAARAEGLPASAAADPAAESPPDPADSVSGLADELHVGNTAEPDVALGGPDTHEATMATMMSGSWAMATRDASPTANASASNDPAGKDLRESDAEMAAIMGAEREAALARHREAAAAAGGNPSGPARARPASEEATEPVTPISDAGDGDARASERPRAAPRRMVAPEPRRVTGRAVVVPEPQPRGRLSLGWAAAFGVLIAGAIWWFQQPAGREAPRTDDKRVAKKSESEKKSPARPLDPPSTPAAADPKSQPKVADEGGAAAEPPRVEAPPKDPPPKDPPPKDPPPKPSEPTVVAEKAPPPTPSKPPGDPRTPPPGTPAEIAAVFVRLPVSPADLPPVGGVGATGVHIDRVEMGASYDKSGCGGVANSFSLAAIDRVNVCLRVVHPRQEETVSIVWQKKDGSTARRGKIAIKPLHAYRTRAYLVLRQEYVGDWTVRIMSADGVELASHAFTIAP